MRKFYEIVDVIKNQMENDASLYKIFDKEVAKEIGITEANLVSRKKRNSIPFEELIIWCRQNRIDIMEILYV